MLIKFPEDEDKIPYTYNFSMTINEHVFQRCDAVDVFWDWWEANHIDLVAAQRDNLYTFPHNNHI